MVFCRILQGTQKMALLRFFKFFNFHQNDIIGGLRFTMQKNLFRALLVFENASLYYPIFRFNTIISFLNHDHEIIFKVRQCAKSTPRIENLGYFGEN